MVYISVSETDPATITTDLPQCLMAMFVVCTCTDNRGRKSPLLWKSLHTGRPDLLWKLNFFSVAVKALGLSQQPHTLLGPWPLSCV